MSVFDIDTEKVWIRSLDHLAFDEGIVEQGLGLPRVEQPLVERDHVTYVRVKLVPEGRRTKGRDELRQPPRRFGVEMEAPGRSRPAVRVETKIAVEKVRESLDVF